MTDGPAFYFPDVPPIPLPAGHRFPAGKYGMLRAAIERAGTLARATLVPSPIAAREDLLRAHADGYVDAMLDGNVTPDAMRRIGLPWSETLVLRSRATVGGAIASARSALEHGISGQLAGGTHHAHTDFGSGFCVFNDLAVAARTLIETGRVARLAIVDTDVHQGDGTAAILGGDERIFLLSIQGERNFPFRRVPSTLDVELADGTRDDDYLAALAPALDRVLAHRPDIVFFLSGADPLKEDRLGRLDLTHEGLARRDALVLGACKDHGIPVSIAIGGGYAEPIEASVRGYLGTFEVASRLYGLGLSDRPYRNER
ncbi:MAG TPA: histone deacetylase [Hyphomicrobiaceae bacterium]|nr:histone deacetylase [Hyphomicrobiaceae bacterium]